MCSLIMLKVSTKGKNVFIKKPILPLPTEVKSYDQSKFVNGDLGDKGL